MDSRAGRCQVPRTAGRFYSVQKHDSPRELSEVHLAAVADLTLPFFTFLHFILLWFPQLGYLFFCYAAGV